MTEKPRCRLIGESGNVFAIMGRVSRALREAGQGDKIGEYVERVTACGSYDEALRITLEYVDMDEEDDDHLVFNRRGPR